MSTFTIELKAVARILYGEQEYDSFTYKEMIYGKLPVVPDPEKIGLGTYPIFDEEYRPILNGKIIDQFYTREIGTETIDNFILIIRRKMDQIMPYYNKLYATEQINYGALDTMSIHAVRTGTNDTTADSTGKTESSTDTKAESRAVNSTSPQTMLSGNGDYATSAADANSTTDVNGESTNETNASSVEKLDADSLVTGYQGVASDLVNRYRASLLNIDTMILFELEECFMLLLNNGDSYTSSNDYYYGWY